MDRFIFVITAAGLPIAFVLLLLIVFLDAVS